MAGFLANFHPLDTPHRTRDRPMQVLALGMPRTGTDSLREALEHLGYGHVYHGFDCAASASDCRAWTELYAKQDRGEKISVAEFDAILGHSAALTDQPCCLFGTELIDAYPDAKVIINSRSDVDAWYRSLDAILSVIEGPWRWVSTWVESESFWAYHFIEQGFVKYFRGDVRKNAKIVYEEHYDRLRKRLTYRGCLEWKAEDGWEPLCKFLGKPVPSEPFPNGNAPAAFLTKMGQIQQERQTRAIKNLAFTFGVILVCVLVAANYWINK